MSLKECIDTTTPQGQFMLTVFDALAQLERGCIRQRSCSGAREKRLNFFVFEKNEIFISILQKHGRKFA